MLTLNKSLDFIAATEADVVSVHRSNSALFMTPEGLDRQPCEAYVCVIREDDQMKIYAALLLCDSKDILVYSLIPDDESTSIQKNLNTALKSMEAMGFAMEPVNLSYGTALREVVVRSISILKPPGTSNKNKTPIKSNQNDSKFEQTIATGKTSSNTSSNSTKQASMNKKDPPVQDKFLTESSSSAHNPSKIPSDATETVDSSSNNISILSGEGLITTETSDLLKQIADKDSSLTLAAAEICELKAHIVELIAARDSAEKAAADDLANLQAEWEDLFEEKTISEKAEIERLTADKIAAEKCYFEAAAQLKGVQELLAAVQKKSEKSSNYTEEKFNDLQQQLDCLETELRSCKTTISSLQSELTEKTSLLYTQEQQYLTEINSLKEEMKNIVAAKSSSENILSCKVVELLVEVDRLSCKRSDDINANIRLAELEAQLLAMQAEQTAAAETAAETISALRSELEIISADYAIAVNAKDIELDQLKTSLEHANSVNQNIETTMSLNLAEIQNELEETKARLSVALENDESSLQLDSGVESIINVNSIMNTEFEKLNAEKTALEISLVKERACHQAEIQRLIIEKNASERASAEELIALKSALARMATEKVAAEQRIFEQIAAGKILPEQVTITQPAYEQTATDISPAPTIFQPAHLAQLHNPISSESIATSKAQSTVAKNKDNHPPKKLNKSVIDKAIADLTASNNDSSTPNDGYAEFIHPKSFSEITDSTDESVMFHLDSSLTNISYISPDEIIEVHNSLNMARINPEGHKTQNCSAYICVVKNQATLSVFVALYLSESKLTIVYTPNRQPTDQVSQSFIVNEAINFAETVGFMMDRMQLDSESSVRAATISTIPIFSESN